jgi:hypothetical protein
MHLEAGRAYRAKTANGDLVTFSVIDANDGGWPRVNLDSDDGPEPNVLLNTLLLLWISSEKQQSEAVSKATEEVIEALEAANGGTAVDPPAPGKPARDRR